MNRIRCAEDLVMIAWITLVAVLFADIFIDANIAISALYIVAIWFAFLAGRAASLRAIGWTAAALTIATFLTTSNESWFSNAGANCFLAVTLVGVTSTQCWRLLTPVDPDMERAESAEKAAAEAQRRARAMASIMDDLRHERQKLRTEIGERQRVELKLRSAREEFQDLYDNSPDYYVSVNASTAKIEQCNETLCTALGFSKSEILGKPVFGLYSPDCLDEVQAAFKLFQETGAVYNAELKLRKQDGSEVDVMLNVSAVRDEDGNIVRSRSVWRDISDRKRAEVAQARLAAIVESCDDAIISKSLDGVVTTWNRGAESLYGYSAEEMVGESIRRVVPADRLDEIDQVLRKLECGAEVQRLETVRVRKDGTMVEVILTISPIYDSDGNVVGGSTIAQDISMRKLAERELAEARKLAEERKFHRFLESTPDAIMIADHDHKIVLANRQSEVLFGCPSEELIGQTLETFIPQHICNACADDGAQEQIVFCKSDKTIFVETRIAKINSEEGDLLVASMRDISERKQAEQERETMHHRLLDLSRRAGMADVATGVLHNVGNVLNSVNVSVSCMAEQLSNSRVEALKKTSDLILANIDNLPEFIGSTEKGQRLPGYLAKLGELLANERDALAREVGELNENVAHIKEIVTMQQSFGQLSGVMQHVDPVEIFEDAVKINFAGLLRHGAQLTREYENDLPWLTTDKHRLLQILINLISNAKYAVKDCEGKQITVRLHQAAENTVQFQVADTGFGIAKENLTRIFNHGFTTREDGHGFGLHSSAVAAKLLGGSLTVFSEGAGKGANFTLTVPCKHEPNDDYQVQLGLCSQ